MLNKAPCSPPGRRATPTKALLTQWSQGASQPNANGSGSQQQQPPPQVKAPLSIHNINTRVINSEYAVRGEIVQLAQKIAKELEEASRSNGNGNGASSSGSGEGASSSGNGEGSNGVAQRQRRYPFNKVVWCNIGNPQILGQTPITYFRQVLALCECPQLLDHPSIRDIFPSDVIDRARMLLEAIPGGVGAYSDSAGAYVLRQLVASAIEKRDGYACSPDDIYMTDGASPAVHYMMDLLLRCNSDGLMVPIPQYPLYSATLTLYGGRLVPYMLDEHNGWGLDVAHLRQQLAAGREQGLCVRGMVVINPGNPTGQCLSYRNMEDILRFAAEEDLVIIADEVYQANIYVDDREFFSFKKVAADLGLTDTVPLVSLHSISKGFIGECGRRGGYMEVTGFPPAVKDQILKLASINLCPNLSGQICCALMMNPPQPGEPSYAQYVAERDSTLGSLRRRAELLVAALNTMEGVTCNTAEGALYAFPRITLPQRACDEARRIGKAPDWLYCKELLEATGIVVVPGSGFGQQDGTFHFRTTFLPSEQDMVHVVQALADFHKEFLAKYGGIGGTGTAQQQQQPELVAVGAGSNGAALSNGKAH